MERQAEKDLRQLPPGILRRIDTRLLTLAVEPRPRGARKLSQKAEKGVGRYLMPEMLPVLDAAMCLAVALSKSPKAKGIFAEIVQGCGMSDFKAIWDRLED